MTQEEWQNERIRRRDELLKFRWKQIEKLKTQSSFWHGKWAIVCHENNVLRSKLRALQNKTH
jgi:citrate synthase